MATNQNRTIVHSRDYSSVRLEVYSTGAAYFRWIIDPERDFSRDLLRITKAAELLESGYLDKIANLLQDEDAQLVTSLRKPELLEYTAARSEVAFKYILDSELSPEAKLIYLISLTNLQYPLGTEELDVIFEKRPNPRAEWKSHVTAFKLDEKQLIRYSLMPGFYSPEQFKDKTLAGYKRISLTSAFICSEKSVTHGEFMDAHREDPFIPHLLVNPNWHLFENVPARLLKDLRPADYVRFMEYFARETPSELIDWKRKRFDEGVIPYSEAKAKSSARLQNGNFSGWNDVIVNLSFEEASEFLKILKEPNGFGSITSGADKRLSPLLAYYFAEGGRSKLNELVQHIIENGPGIRRDFYRGTTLQLNWSNPYSASTSSKPNIAPYVKALAGEHAEYPLDWSLASL